MTFVLPNNYKIHTKLKTNNSTIFRIQRNSFKLEHWILASPFLFWDDILFLLKFIAPLLRKIHFFENTRKFPPLSSLCPEMRFYIVTLSAQTSQNEYFLCCFGCCGCCYCCIFVSYSLNELSLFLFHSSISFLRAGLVVVVAILNVIRNQLRARYAFDDNQFTCFFIFSTLLFTNVLFQVKEISKLINLFG